MSPHQKQIYFKLIALWVICEAMLGGIIHGFKLPVSGLIIGGSAVVCISLIGHLIPYKGSILRATIVVIIFKMLLSPQSPFPAYIAVMFQGICGELLFSTGRKNFKLKCYLLAFLSLLESAFQRVLVMTIVFGVDFWKALNDFISNLTKSDPATNFSLYIVSIYVILHLIVAFFIARFCANIPKLLLYSKEEMQSFILRPELTGEVKVIQSGKKKFSVLTVIWLALLVIYIYNLAFPNGFFANQHSTLKFIFRSSIILLTWYLILAPILIGALKNWLEKQQGYYKEEIREVMLFLPSSKILIRESWKRSGDKRGFARIKLFWKFLIINTLVLE